MSIEKISQARAEIDKTSAYTTLVSFFDEGTFFEIDSFAKSGDNYAEAVTGYGMVDGLPVYAFAQNSDICGGAMSKAQAAKLKKVYDLALKTGAPIVGFYDSIGGKINEGNALLDAYGTMLNLSGNLSGIVPQISVILGNCIGTSALTAANADFIIMSKDAKLTLDVLGKNADAKYNAQNGTVAIVADGKDDAIMQAKNLVTMLPSNNLSVAPAVVGVDASTSGDCILSTVLDADSFIKLYPEYGTNSRTAFARINGYVVGIVVTTGGQLDCSSANKIAKMVRFCDAFSIPVITVVNSTGFESIKSAVKVSSAYAEATTAKIAIVSGTAVGSAYMAMAGSCARTDLTIALEDAIISPVAVQSAAIIMAPEIMKVPVNKQFEVANEFAKSNLNAFNAAENGYIEDVVTITELRDKLIIALDMLSSKRVSTLAKKHSTI